MPFTSTPKLYLAISARLILGFIWIAAATAKALDIGSFHQTLVQGYQLPTQVYYLALFIPVIEVAVGLCLLLTFQVRAVLKINIALIAVFSLMILYGLQGGELESCGCLGLIDDISPAWALARNLLMLMCSLVALKYEPLISESALWNGWLIATACIIMALITGTSTSEPHYKKDTMVYGEQLPDLGVEIPEINDGAVAIFLFKAGCSKCWDAIPQVETFAAEPQIKIVGISPSSQDEIQILSSKLQPSFPIYTISQEVYEKLGQKIPALFLTYDGTLHGHIEGRVPTLTSIRHYTNPWFSKFLVGSSP